jgi:sulfonate transport system substrate-binding protein
MSLACATLAFGITSANAQAVLRIGYLRGTEPLNLMRIQGTLEKALEPHGVKVEWKGPFGAFAPAAEALNANTIDVTVGSSSSALTAMAGEAPMSLFAIEWDGGDNTGIVVPDDSAIKTVKDLVGKTVAVNKGGTGEYLLSRALEQAGVPANDVKKAYLSPPDSAAAMSQKRVDAWAAWSIFYPIALVDLSGRSIAQGGDFKSENSVAYVIRKEFAATNPKAVGILLKTLRDTNAWSQANRAETAKIWERELKLSEGTAKLVTSYKIHPPVPIGGKERTLLDHQNDWLLDQKILKQRVDLNANIIADFGGVAFD